MERQEEVINQGTRKQFTARQVRTHGLEVDGAGPIRRFVAVTFPMISPTTLLAAIITLAGSLQVFAQIQILTSGGPGNATTLSDV